MAEIKNNIKLYLQEAEVKVESGLNRDRPAGRFCMNTVLNLRVMLKTRRFSTSFRTVAKDKPSSLHACDIEQSVWLAQSGQGEEDRN